MKCNSINKFLFIFLCKNNVNSSTFEEYSEDACFYKLSANVDNRFMLNLNDDCIVNYDLNPIDEDQSFILSTVASEKVLKERESKCLKFQSKKECIINNTKKMKHNNHSFEKEESRFFQRMLLNFMKKIKELCIKNNMKFDDQSKIVRKIPKNIFSPILKKTTTRKIYTIYKKIMVFPEIPCIFYQIYKNHGEETESESFLSEIYFRLSLFTVNIQNTYKMKYKKESSLRKKIIRVLTENGNNSMLQHKISLYKTVIDYEEIFIAMKKYNIVNILLSLYNIIFLMKDEDAIKICLKLEEKLISSKYKSKEKHITNIFANILSIIKFADLISYITSYKLMFDIIYHINSKVIFSHEYIILNEFLKNLKIFNDEKDPSLLSGMQIITIIKSLQFYKNCFHFQYFQNLKKKLNVFILNEILPLNEQIKIRSENKKLFEECVSKIKKTI